MKLAALFDIHGNLPALAAVLAECVRAGVERFVIGGDVLPGPMPRECLDVLRGLGPQLECIAGNGERECLAFRGGSEAGVPEPYRAAMRWVAQELREADVAWIESWPATLRVRDILFCHATPRSDAEIVTRETDDHAFADAFAWAGAETVVCGHTHMSFDRRAGRVRVLNAGSVGMPFARTGAEWLLVTEEGAELRHTDYDLEQAAQRIGAAAYPGAKDFAQRYVRTVPGEAAMLQAFSRAKN